MCLCFFGVFYLWFCFGFGFVFFFSNLLGIYVDFQITSVCTLNHPFVSFLWGIRGVGCTSSADLLWACRYSHLVSGPALGALASFTFHREMVHLEAFIFLGFCSWAFLFVQQRCWRNKQELLFISNSGASRELDLYNSIPKDIICRNVCFYSLNEILWWVVSVVLYDTLISIQSSWWLLWKDDFYTSGENRLNENPKNTV